MTPSLHQVLLAAARWALRISANPAEIRAAEAMHYAVALDAAAGLSPMAAAQAQNEISQILALFRLALSVGLSNEDLSARIALACDQLAWNQDLCELDLRVDFLNRLLVELHAWVEQQPGHSATEAAIWSHIQAMAQARRIPGNAFG